MEMQVADGELGTSLCCYGVNLPGEEKTVGNSIKGGCLA